MKRFLITTAAFFLAALLLIVVVFLVVRYFAPSHSMSEVVSDLKNYASNESGTSTDSTGSVVESLNIPEAGLPISSLKLSETQKKTLSTAGINTDTFVITKSMVSCAEEKIGGERVAAIMAGGSPSIKETTSLIPCLKSR